MATITVYRGSVVQADTDAIVNAANERLLGGSGVCGAIFTAAGWDKMQAACDKLSPCPTGQAVATPGFALKAKWVVHTVGPVYRSPALSAPLLYSAYQSALRQADTHGCRSIGLCSISTGIFGYPLKEAVPIALQAMRDFQGETLREIRIYCYGAEEYAAFHAALGEAEKG